MTITIYVLIIIAKSNEVIYRKSEKSGFFIVQEKC